jgi:hypothetical protein
MYAVDPVSSTNGGYSINGSSPRNFSGFVSDIFYFNINNGGVFKLSFQK